MEQMTFFIPHLYEEAPHPWHTGSWKQACPSGHGWGMTPERTLLCIPVTDFPEGKEVRVPEFTQTSWTQQVTVCLKSEKLPDYDKDR